MLQGVEVVRGDFRLGPIDLTIAQGDRIVVTGDNGTGKSTLLGAMLGDLPLSSGRVTLGTRVRIGMIDQQRSLFETEAAVVDLVRAELGDLEAGDVRTLLAKFGLGAEHVDRPSRSLSMGERTRALMAMFQKRKVNVLVLDEPTNHLDVAAIEQLRVGTRRVHRHPGRRQPRRGVPRPDRGRARPRPGFAALTSFGRAEPPPGP